MLAMPCTAQVYMFEQLDSEDFSRLQQPTKDIMCDALFFTMNWCLLSDLALVRE